MSISDSNHFLSIREAMIYRVNICNYLWELVYLKLIQLKNKQKDCVNIL